MNFFRVKFILILFFGIEIVVYICIGKIGIVVKLCLSLIKDIFNVIKILMIMCIMCEYVFK